MARYAAKGFGWVNVPVTRYTPGVNVSPPTPVVCWRMATETGTTEETIASHIPLDATKSTPLIEAMLAVNPTSTTILSRRTNAAALLARSKDTVKVELATTKNNNRPNQLVFNRRERKWKTNQHPSENCGQHYHGRDVLRAKVGNADL